jgi:small-conductance mechanosensitive channel
MRELGISQPSAMAAAAPAAVPAILLRPNLPREVTQFLYKSPLATSILAMTPNVVKSFISSIYPGELLLLLLFRTFYSRLLKFAHRVQIVLWKSANLGTPNEWKSSILGFMHERGKLLSKLITFNYLAKLACGVLGRVGFNIRPDLPDLLSRISYALFLAQFADLFKTQFLRTFFPKVGESKRQSYIINKSASVTIWTIGGLVACEMLSTYLKVPLSSTLAFGGVGGLAVGLSLRDIAANFMGGMMLLFNEPFTPGDMVTFKSGKTEVSVLCCT